ncbi:MAG: N-acetyl-L,L-diaminopimelate deacetylase, partial [uncultured Thermomicrobiales bacterium]
GRSGFVHNQDSGKRWPCRLPELLRRPDRRRSPDHHGAADAGLAGGRPYRERGRQ